MSDKELTKKELTHSERFMNKVINEFASGVGEVALTNFQKRLAQNYFIAIDSTLKVAEEKRLKKREDKRDQTPVTWVNVNMERLSRDVVAYARIGLDPAQKNHINMVPFKNNGLNKYDVTFLEGYRGIELKATKYGLDVPDHVTVELVYSNDKFKSIKKDRNNKYETYEFEITNDFDRGDLIGGFYYHEYTEHPEKNKIVTMNLKEIEKRRPQYASVEFWGGEKDIWENGKKSGKTEHVDGWYEKMVYKTIYRAAYSDITIDSQKIDDDYMRLRQMETDLDEAELEQEVQQNANKTVIDAEWTESDKEPEPAFKPEPIEQEPKVSAEPKPRHQKPQPEQQTLDMSGPGF